VGPLSVIRVRKTFEVSATIDRTQEWIRGFGARTADQGTVCVSSFASTPSEGIPSKPFEARPLIHDCPIRADCAAGSNRRPPDPRTPDASSRPTASPADRLVPISQPTANPRGSPAASALRMIGRAGIDGDKGPGRRRAAKILSKCIRRSDRTAQGDRPTLRSIRIDVRQQVRNWEKPVPPSHGESCSKSVIVILGGVARGGRSWPRMRLTGGGDAIAARDDGSAGSWRVGRRRR
jgi:hypothetical protein